MQWGPIRLEERGWRAYLSPMMKSMSEPLSSLVKPGPPVVPVVRLSGVIASGGGLQQTLSLAGVAGALETAFGIKKAPAVALVINSPGGSPTQSALIHRRIRFLAEEKEKPVLAFVEDAAASGGYMIATAADEIIADPFSIVGSIGVIRPGFGFDKALDRLGIDRRVYTAGVSKSTLDPFKPENPEEVAVVKERLEDIHRAFIAMVQSRRGDKLAHADPDEIYSGLFWTGEPALERGLIDGLGELRSVLRDRFGDKVKTKVIAPGRSMMARLRPGRTEVAGAPIAPGGLIDPEQWISTLEARALWARLGL